MILSLARKDGKLDGTIKIGDQDTEKLTKIEEKDASVIINFTSPHGFDIKLILEKKDDTYISGTLDTGIMGIFDIKGERIR